MSQQHPSILRISRPRWCAAALIWILGQVGVLEAAQFDWPRWGGPDRNGTSRETGLLKEWPPGGPPLTWKTEGLGTGMGGVAVSRGRIYATGDDEEATAWLLALHESNGQPIWKAKIGRGGNPGAFVRPYGPRATPTADGDRIYILSQQGELVCFTTEGKEVWRVHFVEDLGGVMPTWGYAESPLVDGDRILCTPGGEETMMAALDKHTGKVLWKTRAAAGSGGESAGPGGPRGPGGRGGPGSRSEAAYASPIAVDFAGQRQYVQLAGAGLVGVAADDGRLLWLYPRPANPQRINCSTPLYHEGQVFASSAYGAGGGLVKLVPDADGVRAEEVWFTRQMQSHHGGVVLFDGHLYGASGGNEGGALMCLDFRTGEVRWDGRELPGRPAPKGSIALADGRLYFRTEQGAVLLIEPSPKEYLERGRFDQPERSKEPAWPHPVIANGKLYLRYQDRLFCYDIQAR